MGNADLNHMAMQAETLIRDRKKQFHERVRYRILPAATFSASNPPECHSASTYDNPVLTEMLELLQSMNAKFKLCSSTVSPPTSRFQFSVFAALSTNPHSPFILLTAHIPDLFASKT